MVVLDVVLGVLGTLIALENIVVCVLVICYKSLRTYTNGFIVSLAVADFLYGALIIPLFLANASEVINSYILSMVLLANITTLMSVTFDRYLIVLHPFVYDTFMARYFFVVVIVSWLVPISVSLIPLFYASNFTQTGHKVYVYFLVILGVVIPYFLILLGYIRIFQHVVRQVKYLARLDPARDDEGKARQEGKRVTSEAYVARIFAIIAAIFIVSWMPVVYMTFVGNIGRQDLIPKALQMVSWVTLSLGSLVNAPIYAYAKKDFRGVMKRIIFYKRRRVTLRNEGDEPNTAQYMISIKSDTNSDL
ncbi:melanopsin-like [Actinia tenebrosa]|uniref:Melanopsin-like n=1 Tax=Actinia tenebrosa TaxID=6105 RepID=A0A6P8IRD7_ACTTE|nr:melanopsin-like [Actinia tenebrosa]